MEKKKRKPANYWNVKENCIKDAKKYNTRKEWKKKSQNAYSSACKNKWLDECCEHMVNGKLKWTKEECIEDARKYNTRKEWEKNSGSAYSSACKNKWLDECCKHMVNGKLKWSKERCIEDARKYKSRTEWEKNSGSAYEAARKKGWLDECCVHMIPLGNRRKRMVYCYVFSDGSCYVGLTCDEEKRKLQHLNNEKLNSAVFKHIKKTNLIPEYIKISDYIIDIEAQKIEDDTINEYKKNGYNMLNTCKAGALGNNGLMWSKENCIEDAKKYNTRSEWGKNSRSAYEIARKNKWLEECCGHMQNGNIIRTKKYNTKSKWEKKPMGYWSKERCIEDARKYKSRTEWRKNSSSAYTTAWKNGWLDECFPPKESIESLEMV